MVLIISFDERNTLSLLYILTIHVQAFINLINSLEMLMNKNSRTNMDNTINKQGARV